MSRASRGFRLTGKIIKALFFTVIFSLIGILLWRIASSSDPKSMKAVTPNDALLAAYEQSGQSLPLFRQTQNTLTYADENYGFFAVTDCLFIPDANQIQLVFRYNKAAIRSLMDEHGLTEIPDAEDELYNVTLLLATDLTPDNKDDNKGNQEGRVAFTRLEPSSVDSDQKTRYYYRRMVFDLDTVGLSLSDLTAEDGLLLAAYVDIYYVNDVDYEQKSDGTLCVYDYISPRKDAHLTRRDIAAIEAYRED